MAIGPVLEKIRKDLGYEASYVARRLGLGIEAIEEIESGQRDPDSSALAVFSELYGIEPERLWTQDVDPADSEALRLLFLRNTGGALPERTRAAIARASLIARQYVELGALLGTPSAYGRLRERYLHEGEYVGAGQTWQIGEELGQRVRDDLGLDLHPVPSIRRLAEDELGVLIIHTDLRSSDVAACSFSSERTGPVVVVNHAGQNARPWRWRFTVAHEICHVLFDELSQTELGAITSYADQEQNAATDAVEQRANSFAIALLAPKDGVRKHLDKMVNFELRHQVRALMVEWGINFKAARYRLSHIDWASRKALEPLKGVDTKEPEEWLTREVDLLDSFFPCPSIPQDRRGAFARRVVEAYRSDLISRNQLVSLLEAAPDDQLDQLVALVEELVQQ